VVVTVALVVITLSGCGTGEPTMSEYAEQVETLVGAMNARLDALDPLVEGSPTLDDVRTYAAERVALRSEFLQGFRALEPPERLREFHRSAVGVMERLTAAEPELADEVMTLDDPLAALHLWESEAGSAARAADESAIALCKAAQAEFDATEENAIAEGVPWIPAEMKEVVRVALYCERSERP
jgi:hypothetical protein